MKRFTLSLMMILLSSFFIFGQTILLVDRDGSADLGFTDCSGYFMDALDAGGYTYTYYEVTDLTMDGPDLATMEMYELIIWFSGEGWQNSQTMTDNDETNLATYLDGGGFLFFSGQDFLWDRWSSAGVFAAGDFPYDYFGLREVSQDIWFIDATGSADGVAGSLAEGMTLPLQDIFTTDKDGLYLDEMVDHVGMDLFNVTDPTPEGICAVQYESRAFKTVFTTASFAAISDVGVQADLMDAIVDYFFGGAAAGPCYNFDDLTAGGYVADQLGGMWTTWSGAPGGAEDAMVTDAQANSPANSFVIDATSIDLIFQLNSDPISTGKWSYSHYMYVPTGFSGYFNVQSDPAPGVEWNIELYFDDGGTGVFAGQSTETFTYTQDTWFMVEIMYDLDAGMAYVYFDGAMIIEFANTMTIGGIDYFGSDGGGAPGAYYDDVCFEEVVDVDCYNFDDLTVGGYVADQLGGPWTTWSGAPGGSEDAMVTDAQANSPSNSFTIDNTGIDLVFQLGSAAISTGSWAYSHYMYVPTGSSGYFNVQTDPAPGVDWNLELFFDDGGTGSFAGQSTETFTYTQDTWFMVEIMYNLDAGMGYVYIDGTMIIEFENTLTIGGIDYWGSDSGGPPGAFYDDVCFMEYSTADCEGFDELTVGGYAAEQLGGLWTTWSGTPGTAEDAIVSDAVSNSPSNSILIEGTTDLVKNFAAENLISGKYMTSLELYVEPGFCGYFNLQKDVIIGTEWGFQVSFDVDSTAVVDAGGFGAATFTYEPGTWIHNELIIDITKDWAEYYVNGELIHEYQWSLGTGTTPGARTLGGYNLYAWASNLHSPMAYIDDVCFEDITDADCEGFDELTVGGYVAEQLGGLWTTWSGTPGTAEDAIVSDAVSNSPSNSILIEGTTDLVKNFADENLTAGKYWTSLNLYVEPGFCGYFNLQKDVIIGTEWGFQVSYDVDSTAVVDAGGFGAATFDYLPGTWIFNELIIDIDNDLAQYYVDGELIIEYQWSLGTGTTAGATTLGGYNLYAWSSAGNSPMAYIDDVCFEVLVGVGVENPGIAVDPTEVKLYPNPANDHLNIISSERIVDIRIFNQMGQLVDFINTDNKHITINTSSYNAGMYIVQVRTEQGIEVRKLLIQ